ncbi:MAG: DASS family sodium-coupled anion symporter [Myxococcales bacterium]|nr:DASS family sodium-coupled anion symporter [Myxococcales bacterium]USN49798.1 MAG: DASS family sodium-coupled anion symporter [Myxococcales bacterium]
MNHTKRAIKFFFSIFLGILVFICPLPAGLEAGAWQLFAIFLSTISLVMLGVFPMGAASLMGITMAVLTKSMSFQQAFNGFTSPITWLILSAFFISFGFVHTGLGRRIALFFIATFGKSSLGIAYGVGLTELILAPGTPSSTARTGGIIYPVVESIARSFESFPNDKSSKRIGTYLVLCLFNFTVVTSAMFMTAMAANPLTAKLAKSAGIEITWLSWALYAFVPGLTSLLVLPLVMYKISPPEIKDTAHAAANAKTELKNLGPMKSKERLMALGFILLMTLWLLGPLIKVSAVIAALLGMSFLLIVQVFTWEQLLKLHNAFETFIWFGALLALAEGLSSTGFTSWFGQLVASNMSGFNIGIAVALLFAVYFYSHYFFASCTAHVGALFLPFLMGAIALGAKALPFALALSFASSLFGSLTHYGIGPAPILFGSGYVKLDHWWRIGLIMSLVNITIWLIVGGLWWRILGII